MREYHAPGGGKERQRGSAAGEMEPNGGKHRFLRSENRNKVEEVRGGEATRAQARDRARRFCVQNRVEDEEARGGEAAQTLRLRTSGPALCSETEAEAPQASGPALPRLRIFDTCANLIRTLPALRHDERKPEDAAVTPHELTHAPLCAASAPTGARRRMRPRLQSTTSCGMIST